MPDVRLIISVGTTAIEITESNLDRLGPSMEYGAAIDFDRLKEPIASLLGSTVARACAAAGINPDEVWKYSGLAFSRSQEPPRG